MDSHKYLFDKEYEKKPSSAVFEVGTSGLYWWVSTKILLVIAQLLV